MAETRAVLHGTDWQQHIKRKHSVNLHIYKSPGDFLSSTPEGLG